MGCSWIHAIWLNPMAEVARPPIIIMSILDSSATFDDGLSWQTRFGHFQPLLKAYINEENAFSNHKYVK